MTRTWFRVHDWPIFAWAGFCRRTEEWGSAYAAMTTDSSPAVAALNPRMPVILAPRDYERWLEGSIEDVIAPNGACLFRGDGRLQRGDTAAP
jgi:putative SOS response-associated peptidase YedK